MFALAGPIVADFAALNHAIHIAASLLPAGFSVFTLLLAQPAAAKLGGPAALRGLRSRLPARGPGMRPGSKAAKGRRCSQPRPSMCWRPPAGLAPCRR